MIQDVFNQKRRVICSVMWQATVCRWNNYNFMMCQLKYDVVTTNRWRSDNGNVQRLKAKLVWRYCSSAIDMLTFFLANELLSGHNQSGHKFAAACLVHSKARHFLTSSSLTDSHLFSYHAILNQYDGVGRMYTREPCDMIFAMYPLIWFLYQHVHDPPNRMDVKINIRL